MTAHLAGTGALARLVLRRDRVRLTVWSVTLSVLVGWTAYGIQDLYSEPELLAYAVTADGNATIVALSGPTRGLATYGGRIAFEVWQLALAFALFGVLSVTRHTRHEEEAGRTELLRAAVVGRHAGSAAALLVTGAVAAAIGLACAGLLAAQGLDATGSVVLGLGLTTITWAFAAIGLLAAQVTEHGRAATGLGLAAMGATYVARAVGDVGSGALSWASPFGWAQAAHPFTGDRWWPLLVGIAATVGIAAVAFGIEARRDVGAGLVAPRSGPARAGRALAGPLGLAWRLQRGTVVAWMVGAALLGALMGSVADSADDLVGDNQEIRDYLAAVHGGASLDDVFLATILVYLALLAAGCAVQATVRARSEETAHRAEVVLATATSRRAWAGSHVLVALGGGTAVLLVSSAAMGLGYGLASGAGGQVLRSVAAGAAFLPALAVVTGAAVAAFGLWPRTGALVWGLLAVSVVVGIFGDGLRLPRWFIDLSPFSHVPAVPAEAVVWTPLLVLTGVAVVLLVAGAVGLDRRDVG